MEFSPIDSLSWLDAYKSTLHTLILVDSGLTSLKGIEEFINLTHLSINRTNISDLSPLLLLPGLQEVRVSPPMANAAREIEEVAGFRFSYSSY